MKIVKALRAIHDEALPKYSRLVKEVRDVLKPKVESRGWFFQSRVKTLESFALKVESGRVADPSTMEDFVGCTIVVPTVPQLLDAEVLVKSLYDSQSRRPGDDSVTHKASSSFTFDDLRLYVAYRATGTAEDTVLKGAVFEVQIKTILQHAWSVATHDLIYKTDAVDWPLERIAYQVKAMLEHAEVAIAEAAHLTHAPSVAKRDPRTRAIGVIIKTVKLTWPGDQLPADVKRLAETIWDLFRACDLPASDLGDILQAEKDRIGIVPTNLSPYSFVVQALAQNVSNDFKKRFNGSRSKCHLVVHEEMDVPEWMRAGHKRILLV